MSDDDDRVVRVTIERASGSVISLDGDAASAWEDATNSQASFCLIHGLAFPALPWKRSTSPTPVKP